MKQQRRGRTQPCWRGIHSRSTIAMILLLAVLTLLSLTTTVMGKEIVATKEWQVVGENDTIPAGVHVRMDLTTGEKMVKLVEKDGEDETAIQAVAVDADGGVTEVVPPEDLSAADAAADSSSEAKEPDYDYEMMHRTLSKLPPEEQDRMGGLPELPAGGQYSTMTEEQREHFEARMKEIWVQRQAELKEFQEDFMLDLPEVLKDRIRRIKAYLADPYPHLVEVANAPSGTTTMVDEENAIVTHIVSVLEDVEYHLNDLDMTRDFHTLGGWPLLVSLLSPETHLASNSTLTDELFAVSRDVQAKAAWVIGTAVKNTEEFFPYAIEEVTVGGSSKTSALALLLEQLNAQETDSVRQKMIYGIGAMLRGNRLAQHHCLSLKCSEVLSKALESSVDDKKLTRRILTLVGDIVTDLELHPGSNRRGEMKILGSFASDKICEQSLGALMGSDRPLRETAFRTVHALAGKCKRWKSKKVTEAINKAMAGFYDDGLDSEELSELTQLAEEAKKKL